MRRTSLCLQMDQDGDGKISEKDLATAMNRVGYSNISSEVIKQIISDVDKNRDGRIEFGEYLDAIAGMKEVDLHSPFSTVVDRIHSDSSSSRSNKEHEASAGAKERRFFRRQIPVDRSGGGT